MSYVLGVYGVIIFLSAFYYRGFEFGFVENPGLWWGAVMVIFAVFLWKIGKEA